MERTTAKAKQEENKGHSAVFCKNTGFLGSLFGSTPCYCPECTEEQENIGRTKATGFEFINRGHANGDILYNDKQQNINFFQELEQSDEEKDMIEENELNANDDDSLNLSYHQTKLLERGFVDLNHSIIDVSTITKIWYKSMLYECAICCCQIEEDNLICTFCSQHYHEDCIKSSHRNNPQCPMCRAACDVKDFIPDVNYKSKIIEMKNHMNKANQIAKCSKHNRSTSLYCSDCKKCVCDLCIVSKSHKSHEFVKFMKIYNSQK